MVTNMLFKRKNASVNEFFTSVRNSLASEWPDVTLVCGDGKRVEAPSRLLSFLSPLLRSISTAGSNQILLLPDFSPQAVTGVINLLKRKENEEVSIKLTRQQIDLLICLGFTLTNLEEVVDVQESLEQVRLVCDLCDKNVTNAMEHMLEHSQEVGHLSSTEVDSFFHKEGGQQVINKTRGSQKSSQIQFPPTDPPTRSRRRGRSLDTSSSTKNRGLVVSDYVFCKLERNASESRPPPAKKQRVGRRMGKNRRVCYVQAGRRALKKMKIKAEKNSSVLNEDDFQLTLDVARTLAGRSTPQQVENPPEVVKASAIEKSAEIEERNMEMEPRSTSHMTLRPKLRSVSVQLLKYKKSHNPNKGKRLHKSADANKNKNKKPQTPDNEKESATENIESSLNNKLFELENIVDDLSYNPEVTIVEMKESPDLEIREIEREPEMVPPVVPLEIQLSEIDKEIAGLEENLVVELDNDVELDESPGVELASCEVENIQEQLMKMNDTHISDDEEDDGEIVFIEQQKKAIEVLPEDSSFGFDNIEEILSVSLDEGSQELSLW